MKDLDEGVRLDDLQVRDRRFVPVSAYSHPLLRRAFLGVSLAPLR